MELDPTITNRDNYRVVMENDRVRVLEYRDRPGHRTTPHRHPDSVMVTLSLRENIGETDTHVSFVELKEPNWSAGSAHSIPLGRS